MGNLTQHDKDVLKRSGFVPLEIKQFDEAQTVDGKPQNINLSNDMWKKALSDREKHMKRYLKGGADYKQYETFMGRLRGKQGDSAFDFLKAEYARYLPQGKEVAPTDKKAAAIVRKIYGDKWWLDKRNK